MTRVVWKYSLLGADSRLSIPPPGIVRAVAWQHDNPTMWIEVSPYDLPVPRRFIVVATGTPLPEGLSLWHLGSCISDELVFHVYEVIQ